MKRIKLGRTEIIADNSPPSVPAQTQLLKGQDHQIEYPSLGAAQGDTNLKILQPSFIPTAMKFVYARHHLDGQQNTLSIVTKYRGDENLWMVIDQSPLPDIPSGQTIAMRFPFAIWGGTVAGRPAAFFAHDVIAREKPNGVISISHCLWEYNSFLVELESHGLTQEEVIHIAESLT